MSSGTETRTKTDFRESCKLAIDINELLNEYLLQMNTDEYYG